MNNTFKICWSKLSIGMTFVVCAIIVGLIIGFIIEGYPLLSLKSYVLAFILVSFLYVASYTPVRIKLTDNALIIQRLLGSTRIPVSQILSCQRFYPGFTTKICGSGGFCGSLGWYRTNDTGSFLSYATDWNEAVIIDTPKRKYVVSCENPDKLIADFNSLKQ